MPRPTDPEERALLDAILANPDDDDLRLVYADWLEERGDERAEFVRREVAIDAMPEVDDDYWLMHYENQRLRRTCPWSWIAIVTRPRTVRRRTERQEGSAPVAWLPDLVAGVRLACKPTHVGRITEGRQRVAVMPREWTSSHVESIGRCVLNLDESWEFGRFLELLDELEAGGLLLQFVDEGLAHSEFDGRDLADCWRTRLHVAS